LYVHVAIVECLSVRVDVRVDNTNVTQTLTTDHISITKDGENITPGAPIYYNDIISGYVFTTEVGDCEFPCPDGMDRLEIAYFTGSTTFLSWSVDENLVTLFTLFNCGDDAVGDICYAHSYNTEYRFRTCVPSSKCHHLIARNHCPSCEKDTPFFFNLTVGSDVVASWDNNRFSFKSVSFDDDCQVCQDNESLVEIFWDRDRTEASYPTISWSLEEDATGSAFGGSLSRNDTQLKYYHECIEASTCATFRATVPETFDILVERSDGSFENETYGESGLVNVRVDGVVFIETYELGSDAEHSPFAVLLPVGECTIEDTVCDTKNEHVLDTAVTTGSDVHDGYQNRWKVLETYDETNRDRIVLDNNAMFEKFLSDTTYRTYQCLPKSSNCTDFVIQNEGVETYTVRLDGNVVDQAADCIGDDESCACTECSQMHLFGNCEDSGGLSRGAIIGIASGATCGFFFLLASVGYLWCGVKQATKEADGSENSTEDEVEIA